MLNASPRYYLGIDLGTTFTRAAVQVEGEEQVSYLELGSAGPDMPTLATIAGPRSWLVGDDVVSHLGDTVDPDQIIKGWKPWFGDTESVSTDSGAINAMEVARAIFEKIRSRALKEFRSNPDRTILTYPTAWSPSRVKMLQTSAQQAGLSPVDTISAAEATAVAYDQKRQLPIGTHIAIYDVGGGITDVAVVKKLDRARLEVVAVATELRNVGGDDIDESVHDYVRQQLSFRGQQTSSGLDSQEIRNRCAAAKEMFTSGGMSEIGFPSGETLVTLRQDDFSRIVDDLFAEALIESKDELDHQCGNAVDHVIVVGGVTKILQLRQRIIQLYGRQPNPPAVSPPRDFMEHSQAVGAALAAARRSQELRIARFQRETESRPKPVPVEGPPTTRPAAQPRLRLVLPAAVVVGALIVAILPNRLHDGSRSGNPSPPVWSAGSDTAALDNNRLVVPAGKPKNQLLFSASAIRSSSDIRRYASKGRGDYYNPAISSDRRTILYIDRKSNDIRKINADGTGDQRVSSPPAECGSVIRISWDGRSTRVVAICQKPLQVTRLLLKFDLTRTPHPIVLSTGTGQIDDAAISPDGAWVLYWKGSGVREDGGSIYKMLLAGTQAPERLTESPNGSDADPAWSPLGTKIAFRRMDKEGKPKIWTMDQDGRNATQLTNGDTGDVKPAWSPDGDRLAYVSRSTIVEEAPLDRVFVKDLRSGEEYPLGVSAAAVSAPTWGVR